MNLQNVSLVSLSRVLPHGTTCVRGELRHICRLDSIRQGLVFGRDSSLQVLLIYLYKVTLCSNMASNLPELLPFGSP